MTEISSYRRHTSNMLSHVLVIGMLFVLPEVLVAMAFPSRHSWTTPAMYLKSLVFIAVFYVNYYLIIDRTLGDSKVKVWRFVALNLLVLAVALLADYVIWQHFGSMRGPRRMHENMTTVRHILRYMSFYVRDAVVVVLTIGLAVAIRLSDRWRALERRNREIEIQQHRTELDGLRNQLNPHFLFNTLNSIYALIAISPVTAQKAVHELSQLLRYVLYESPGMIPVGRELDFVRNYVSLMKLRLPEDVVRLNIDVPDDSGAQLPPMLLVTLIENAFKHGNTGRPGDTIDISVVLDGTGNIVCSTSNRYNAAARTDGSHGIGLSNLSRRLELVYGSAATLDIVNDGDVFRAKLIIPAGKTVV